MLSRLVAGDRSVWNGLWEETVDKLLYFVMKKRGFDKKQALEWATEAFTVLWEYRHKVEDMEHAKRMLYAVVNRKTIDAFRTKKSRRRFVLYADIESAYDELFVEEVGLRYYHSAELVAKISEFIDLLPPQQKKVIELTIAGKNSTQIGHLLGIVPNTARHLKKQAIANLHGHFAKLYNLKEYILE